MSIKDIIRESNENNPLEVKKLVREELNNRMAELLEKKMSEKDEDQSDEDESDEDEDESEEDEDED